MLVGNISNLYALSQCSQVFPGGLSITSSSGNITFNQCSYVKNNPSTQLTTPSITTNASGCSPPTCYTATCTASGGTAAQLSLGAFPTISSSSPSVTVNQNGSTTIGGNGNQTTTYGTVTLSGNSTLNFSANPNNSTLYKINTLTLNGNGNVINFQPGDYWIQNFNCNNGVTFNVVGAGTARLYFQGFSASGTLNWNNTSTSVNSNPTPSQLLVVSYGGITFNNVANINGLIYANGQIIFDDAGIINGAVSGQNITLNDATNIQYNSTAVSNLNFGSLCNSSSSTSQLNVSAPSIGTHCQNMTITVTAQNSNNQTVTSYNGAITVSTQNGIGTWVSTTGSGTFSGGSNGVATYQFASADNGVASFQLNYPSNGASPLTVKTYQTNNTSISGLSGPISFIPSGILVTAGPVQNPPTPAPATFSTPQTSGNNFTMYLTAYNPSNCGIITSYTGDKTIRFWTSYVNPTSGTIKATINGTNIANSAGATQTTQSINFNNGVATVTGRYTDVGQLTLNVQDTSTGGPSGVSGNFVIMPAQFAINIPGNSASQTPSPSNTAQAACLGNTIFKKAGQSFTVNVQPQNSLGGVTPNYGNEKSPQGIILQSSVLVAPTSGRNGSNNDGAIGNGSSFTKVTNSSGPFALAPYFTGSNFSFDEVGCINLTASVVGGSYLGAGNVSSSIVVGRFIPDHLDASGNTPVLATGCSTGSGSFTYLDQPFLYGVLPVLTVTARAVAGTTTQNYTGSFWKLASTTLGNAYNHQYYPVNGTDVIPNLTLTAVNPTPVFVDGGNGTGTFTFSDGGGFKIQRQNNTLVFPFTAEIQLRLTKVIDSDSVSCTNGCSSSAFNFGGTAFGRGISFNGTGGGKQFYHGRMIIVGSIGSELLPLTVPIQNQYYTSGENGFNLNLLDSCTTFPGGAANIILTPSTGLSTTSSLPSPVTFNQGNINLGLSAPNVSGTVAIEANLNSSGANLPWLQFNWPYAGSGGTYTADPRGVASFGIYKGNDRIIYFKEVFN